MTSSSPSSKPHLRRGKFVRILLVVALLLTVSYLGISAYMVEQLPRTTRRCVVNNPAADALNFENISFRSLRDDLTLRGWLLKADADEGRVVIMVHGYNGARDDENNGMYRVAQALLAQHFSVLMFDLRGCGQSEGDRFSLAWFEQQDVRGAIRYAQSRGYAHIGLLGYSMGAASSLLAAADEPAVQAVVEDSAYADLMDVLDREVPKRSGLPGIFTPGIVLMAKFMYGIEATAVKPAEAAARLGSRPLLIIHGQDDTLIPFESAERIWHARYGAGTPDPATYYIVPGADHTQAFKTENAEYMRKVGGFFAQYLK
jgi:alpha-beta hydrolase superfamily lysophospholipase